MASKVSELKHFFRLPSVQELRKSVKVSEEQQQLSELQRELSKAKEELAEMRKLDGESFQSKDKIRLVESQALMAREAERSMLEAIVSQTKQLEQTKISLEESKLEVRNLQESIRKMEGLAKKNGSLESATQEELRKVRKELRSALEAEEKSKRAMDSFAATLIELTAEANKGKTELAVTRAELENAKAEALSANSSLESTERKLMEALDRCDRLKLEYEDSAAAWKSKEEGLLSCKKASEEEIAKEKEDNSRLNDAWKLAREENSRLRDAIKHAVDETTMVKEALETAQNENSLLKHQLHEKENALRQLKHELESLKVSEAAAIDSVRELKSLLASSSAVDSKNTPNFSEPGSLELSNVKIPGARKSIKILSFERWKQDSPQVRRRHSVGEAGLLEGSSSAIGGSIRHKNRMFGSISNVSDMQVPSSLFGDERRNVNSSKSDLLEITPSNETVAANHKKKKTVLGRIGDVLRRRSFHR